MPPDSIDLDGRRSDSDKQATEIRRRLDDVRQDQNRLEQRLREFESYIIAGPAGNWPEAAAKAQYLIQLLADSYGVRDPRQRALIESVFQDFAFLTGDGDETQAHARQRVRRSRMEFETNGDHRGCHYISRITISDRQGRVHVRTDVAIDLNDDATATEELAFRAISPHGSASFVSELEGWGMSRMEVEVQAAKIVRDRIDAIFGPTVPA